MFVASLFVFTIWDSMFPSATLRLPNTGSSISLFGRGPPCMFSSGLFGLMPRRLYTQLFSNLMSNMTIVVLNDARPVTQRIFEDAAVALGVDKLALFSHSALDKSILYSPLLHRAVLCDPVVLPATYVPLPFLAKRNVDESEFLSDFLVLRAGQAYTESGIPDFLFPFSNQGDVVTYEGLGHADLLDDRWADLGATMIPWMNGMVREKSDFWSWSNLMPRSKEELRKRYRHSLSKRSLQFILDQSPQETVLSAFGVTSDLFPEVETFDSM